MHEVLAAEPGAAAGFCALLLARTGGTVLWIAAEPDAWPPGLARFGLSPADLVLVQAPRPVDGLWAMEEALRCSGVSGALLVLRTLDLTAARRLQLAAESRRRARFPPPPGRGGIAGGASAALTRWRVGALPGTGGAGKHDLGDPRWQLDLLRCRGGKPGSWQVVWRGAAERLELDGNTEAEQARGRRCAPPPPHDGGDGEESALGVVLKRLGLIVRDRGAPPRATAPQYRQHQPPQGDAVPAERREPVRPITESTLRTVISATTKAVRKPTAIRSNAARRSPSSP